MQDSKLLPSLDGCERYRKTGGKHFQGRFAVTALAFVCMAALVTMNISCQPQRETVFTGFETSISGNLMVYLDANYTTEWNGFNQPDLDALDWRPLDTTQTTVYEWLKATLTVYVANIGTFPIWVNAELPMKDWISHNCHSDTIRLAPGERRPMDIELSYASDWGVSSSVQFSINFNVKKGY